jgi:DNA-binding MarR family transcriptional regulator
LTKYRAADRFGGVTTDQAVELIQFAYPQIYYACHTRHERRKSNVFRLSARDSDILVHLDRRAATRVTALARHLEVAASTLSAAVTRLETLGYVAKARDGRDRRSVSLLLTPVGAAAVRGTSVLEAARIGAALRRLTARERARAVEGLKLLAGACRQRG